MESNLDSSADSTNQIKQNFKESSKSTLETLESRQDSTLTLALIVPFYNESEIILKSLEVFSNKLQSLKNINGFIIFVDDGSSDNSASLLKMLCAKIPLSSHLARM